jgi:hypothetical protein
MTHRGSWKRVERKISRKLGGERNPLSGGSSRHTRGDTIHDKYYVEVKFRARIPFFKDWTDAQEKAKLEGKIPMFVFHEKGRKQNDIVFLRLDDFVKLTGDADEEDVEESGIHN